MNYHALALGVLNATPGCSVQSSLHYHGSKQLTEPRIVPGCPEYSQIAKFQFMSSLADPAH